MKIKKIHIRKFRGFKDIEFELGTNLTAIAGQNGTQKTTILGLLTQPFTITDDANPIKNEKPLTGGNFKSAFSEKFKLSDSDKPGSHEWTLYLDNMNEPFTLVSIPRDKKNNTIRFWRKGTKEKGSGYLQLPVIFLSLKRLIPIGEDKDIDVGPISLTEEEIKFCIKYHKKILLLQDDIKKTEYLESKIKNTLGVNTTTYDWKQNSAGQDNIGKILLAILSFKRLKEKYLQQYNGGILAIDEIEATLYPASQEKLVEFLSEQASLLNLQIFFTTHSLEILKKIEANSTAKNKIVFFEKVNNNFIPHDDHTYEDIVDILTVTSSVKSKTKKLKVFCEDEETRVFVRQILGTKITKYLEFDRLNLGGQEYISLAKHKFPPFTFPNSLIILDGDMKSKIPNKFQHILSLPSTTSPEKALAIFLNSLDDTDNFWTSIAAHYNKQVCFRNYTFDEILEDRAKAKKWFNEQKKKYWGKNANKAINYWMKKNRNEIESFKKEFIKKYNIVAKKLELNKIKEVK